MFVGQVGSILSLLSPHVSFETFSIHSTSKEDFDMLMGALAVFTLVAAMGLMMIRDAWRGQSVGPAYSLGSCRRRAAGLRFGDRCRAGWRPAGLCQYRHGRSHHSFGSCDGIRRQKREIGA